VIDNKLFALLGYTPTSVEVP